MRILYVLSSTTPYGGASKSFLNLVKWLAKTNVTPLVIVPDNGGLCSQLDEWGIEYHVLFYRYCVYPPIDTTKDKILFIPRLIGRIYANCVSTLQLCAIARRFHPDLIHTNVSVVSIGYKAARLLHIPHIWHIREYGDKDFNLHYYPTRQSHIRDLHKPLSYSISITHDIAKYNQLNEWKQSIVIYNGIFSAEEDITPINHSQRENIFLFAGHIEPAKGILEMVKAYVSSSESFKERHKLLLAGKETNAIYYEQIQKYIAQFGKENEIVFLGEVANLQQYIQKSKAVIIPSISEGFGRVMPEAMHLNTLIIAHNTAGSKEQLDNGVNVSGGEIGLRYDSPDELINHFISVANNKQDVYTPMIERARIVVDQLYSNEQYASNIYHFYQKILQL